MEKVRWFQCPGCDRIVTGMVREGGPRNHEHICPTHCCFLCKQGRGHDDWWCAGTPASVFREAMVSLPSFASSASPRRAAAVARRATRAVATKAEEPRDRREVAKAHYILHEPDWSVVEAPVPACLLLHGGLTYVWPETLHGELARLVERNPVAARFVLVAPLATKGEPLAVRTNLRKVPNRFEREVPYVESFDPELTWECFLAACQALGPERIDFSRLSATGFSMGAQACWDLALSKGSLLSAIAPMAGSCLWPMDAWSRQDGWLDELGLVAIKAFSIETDFWSYKLADFEWLARRRGLYSGAAFSVATLPEVDYGPGVEVTYRSWGHLAQLGLIRGWRDGHNCWDLVYHGEETFHLFEWLASMQNAGLLQAAAASQHQQRELSTELGADWVSDEPTAEEAAPSDEVQRQEKEEGQTSGTRVGRLGRQADGAGSAMVETGKWSSQSESGDDAVSDKAECGAEGAVEAAEEADTQGAVEAAEEAQAVPSQVAFGDEEAEVVSVDEEID